MAFTKKRLFMCLFYDFYYAYITIDKVSHAGERLYFIYVFLWFFRAFRQVRNFRQYQDCKRENEEKTPWNMRRVWRLCNNIRRKKRRFEPNCSSWTVRTLDLHVCVLKSSLFLLRPCKIKRCFRNILVPRSYREYILYFSHNPYSVRGSILLWDILVSLNSFYCRYSRSLNNWFRSIKFWFKISVSLVRHRLNHWK